jgi:hypothetical protein
VTEPTSGPPEDKAGDPVLVRAVLGLYPRTWRDRYGDEFGRLMTDLLACVSWRRRIRLVVNAAMGAADAHLRLPGGRVGRVRHGPQLYQVQADPRPARSLCAARATAIATTRS